jgi:hypothetical protein
MIVSAISAPLVKREQANTTAINISKAAAQ